MNWWEVEIVYSNLGDPLLLRRIGNLFGAYVFGPLWS